MGKRTIRSRVYSALLYFEQMNEVFLMEENVLYATHYYSFQTWELKTKSMAGGGRGSI